MSAPIFAEFDVVADGSGDGVGSVSRPAISSTPSSTDLSDALSAEPRTFLVNAVVDNMQTQEAACSIYVVADGLEYSVYGVTNATCVVRQLPDGLPITVTVTLAGASPSSVAGAHVTLVQVG